VARAFADQTRHVIMVVDGPHNLFLSYQNRPHYHKFPIVARNKVDVFTFLINLAAILNSFCNHSASAPANGIWEELCGR
jgi:hypothetical protein